MSELIDNARKRKDLLKHMIKQLHDGDAPDEVKTQLTRLLGKVPYDDVVEVEQELISDGLPETEILKLCDIHSQVLKGSLDTTEAKKAPAGHPVDTFQNENKALEWKTNILRKLFSGINQIESANDLKNIFLEIKHHFISLTDVEKHYARKENLLFPFLEKHNITGPPKVMWGKHDEIRELFKAGLEAFDQFDEIDRESLNSTIDLIFKPAVDAIEEMIYKEENILFPMCLDTLSDGEWYNVYRQSVEIGFCLYDPEVDWRPSDITEETTDYQESNKIQLPSGSFTPDEIQAMLNTIPFDLTFVDKDDTVKYFTQGKERIFARNRAILGRKVQLCHPPSSVHIVQKILDDFKSGAQDKASFWIGMKDQFISIEYFALRDAKGEYLGVLEVSQNLTEKRALQGERRLLQYE
jgi:DUF438 domain-containing protein